MEGEVFSSGRGAGDVVDLTGSLDTGFHSARVVGGDLVAGFLASLVKPCSIPAGDDALVAEIHGICLKPGTAAGEYTLTVEYAELVDDASSRAIHPEVSGASLVVSEAVDEATGCDSMAEPDPGRRCDSPVDPPDPPDPPLGPQADFLRGDVNSDGVVSVADAHFLLSFLFRGKAAPECGDAADHDDSGRINITDAVRILNHLVLGGAPPEAPYPDIGPDETVDESPWLVCDSYGGGTPLDDPAAEMALVEAVAPGGDDRVAVVTIAVSSSHDLAGYGGRLAAAGGEIVAVAGAPVDLTGTLESGFLGSRYDDGGVVFGFLANFVDDGPWIAAGSDVALVEIPVCLLEGTVAGDYAITLESAEMVEADGGRAIWPERVDGILTVHADLSPGVGCSDPGDPGDPGDPPDTVESLFRIEPARAAPDESLDVPFTIRANVEVQAYSISVDYDEEVVRATDVLISYDKPDGSAYGFSKFEINDDNLTPGSDGVDEGFIVGAAVFSFLDNDNNMPANEDTEALAFRFDVVDGTTATETEVLFLDGGKGSGQAVHNVITANGTADVPETVGAVISLDGSAPFLPQVGPFLRGDSNGDGILDIADPRHTLSWLFLGSAPPRCLDAADANDDGRIDVSDSVATLQFLFTGGKAPAQPFPEPGEDPTSDSMDCSS